VLHPLSKASAASLGQANETTKKVHTKHTENIKSTSYCGLGIVLIAQLLTTNAMKVDWRIGMDYGVDYGM